MKLAAVAFAKKLVRLSVVEYYCHVNSDWRVKFLGLFLPVWDRKACQAKKKRLFEKDEI